MGLIPKIGEFLGIKKFGQGIASTIRIATGEVNKDIQVQQQNDTTRQKFIYLAKKEADPTKRKQLLQMANGIQTTTPEQIDPGLNLSNKEILGSAANLALNVLLAGNLSGGVKAGGLISKVAPGVAKGLNTAVKVAQPLLVGGGNLGKITRGATLGGAFGAASGLEKNRNLSGIAGSTVGGMAIGGVLSGTMILAGKAKDAITKKTSNWLMDKAVKPALQDLKKNVKYGGDTLGKQLLDEGIKGGPKKLLEITDTKLNQFENELQTHLNTPELANKTIKREQILPYVKDIIEQKTGVPGLAGEAKKISGIIESMPEELTLPEANIMKRRIYAELRDPAYRIDAKLSTKAQALKSIARGLKEEIKNTAKDAVSGLGQKIEEANQKLSIYGRLENAMVDQLARGMRNNGLSLTDAVLASGGLAGSLIGAGTGNESTVTPISFATALGLILARHNSTLLNTYMAQGLRKTGEVLSGRASQLIKNQVIKRGILNLP